MYHGFLQMMMLDPEQVCLHLHLLRNRWDPPVVQTCAMFPSSHLLTAAACTTGARSDTKRWSNEAKHLDVSTVDIGGLEQFELQSDSSSGCFGKHGSNAAVMWWWLWCLLLFSSWPAVRHASDRQPAVWMADKQGKVWTMDPSQTISTKEEWRNKVCNIWFHLNFSVIWCVDFSLLLFLTFIFRYVEEMLKTDPEFSLLWSLSPGFFFFSAVTEISKEWTKMWLKIKLMI